MLTILYFSTDLFSLVLKSYPKVAVQNMLERFSHSVSISIKARPRKSTGTTLSKNKSLQDSICIQDTKPLPWVNHKQNMIGKLKRYCGRSGFQIISLT